MQTILTLTMNPSVDTNVRIDQVMPEKNFDANPPHTNLEAAGSMYPVPYKNWAANPPP